MEAFYNYLSNYVILVEKFDSKEIPLRQKMVNIIVELKLTKAEMESDEGVKLIILKGCDFNHEEIKLLQTYKRLNP